MYQRLLSPSRSTKSHKKCSAADCPPFGRNRSCNSPLLNRISKIVHACKPYIPSINILQLFTLYTINELDAIVVSYFPIPAPTFKNQWYLDCRFRITQLQEAARLLAQASTQFKYDGYLQKHDPLLSDNAAFIVVRNLKTLYSCISKRRRVIEGAFWKGLDEHPEESAARLQTFMTQLSDAEDSFSRKFQTLTLTNFRTLGAKRWLDDEVVNYFIQKWCFNSGTLGLNTFFVSRCLFKAGTSIPKDGFLTEADEVQVERWCSKAASNLGLQSWDSVFIPINENQSHWYSARIDFRLKRIDIYDSLRERCIDNRQKPPLLRKNAGLMLILMWLTEVLSRLRGKEVQLQNKLGTGWVHFQANTYDCGVHMLWHLRHILEFRQVMLGAKCSTSHLRFSDNMVGKRLRLALEIVEDSGLV
ncbi:hypothetical protein D9757_013605 [Collybiopsis confluens]|uniref:Ubiquitin-like protease family profile domain-containing protein n=1 Tax=Collybiopsis confluens TaxID=2823264 RepID=A0A8H5GA31_9AGAR|nr:hypothetical protein D9757_013605 [Collybiopsis confluens]